MRKLFCVILSAMLLTGCAAGDESSGGSYDPTSFGTSAEGYAFTDDLGRSVTVKSCERVAALLGSFAEVWHLAGGEVTAAPDDAWDDFDFPLPDSAVNLGKTKELSLETLFSVAPDFVIASTNTRIDLEWLDTLESAEIPVAYFDVADFADYLHMLDICTDITKRKDLYKTNGTDIGTKIDKVKAQSKSRITENSAPSVLSLRASAAGLRAKNSSGNVLGEMLKTLGCMNIADSEESLLENLSMEYIISSDPDFIFIVQHGDDIEGFQRTIDKFVADNPAWEELTAVKEGRVYIMDKHLYNQKPNVRWGEAYEELERILSGER